MFIKGWAGRAAAGLRWRPLLEPAQLLTLALLALLPRVLDLGLYLTNDEANFWLTRSNIFLTAVQSGDYAATAITTHPGVTTMWLGAAGIVLRRALVGWGLLRQVDFGVSLALMRLPAALVHSGAVLLGYALLRRMLPRRVAYLAALLWAADPFVIGYSRLLHVDALAGTFATLALLAACLYWSHGRAGRFLLLSGVCGGLAALSKSPALALLPAVALLAALTAWREHGTLRARAPWRQIARSYAVWLLVFGLTVLACWPALWISPLRAYQQVQIGVLAEGAQPHMLGNFFMGREDDAPGLLYYPVALALRLTPWTLLGLLALGPLWRQAQSGPIERADLAGLAGFVLLFTLAMSVFPKKFDRYLVPVFPALDVLAALGLVTLVGWALTPLLRGDMRGWLIHTRARAALLAAVGAAALLNAAWWHPYGLAAFNQILGGAPAGARTFAMGWGEGMDQVAAWLNQQPDITQVSATIERSAVINPLMRTGARMRGATNSDVNPSDAYLVVYLSQVQAGPPLPPYSRFYGRATPLHTVRIHGVDYAWIYRVPPPTARKIQAEFGGLVQLYGVDRAGAPERGQDLRYRLTWYVPAQAGSDPWLFAHLIGPDGRRYAQADIPYPVRTWPALRYTPTELPLRLPADAPAGAYRVVVGLYDQPSGQRLPLKPASPADRAADTPEGLLLDQFTLP